MRFSKRFRLITIFVILFASLVVCLTQVDSVQATFSNAHAFTVLLRVETEIMQKTSAGKYYDSLFWKHAHELNQIMISHPEHNEALLQTIRAFIPGLEALLNGKGDTVSITPEQIEALKAELDWFHLRGSPALRQNIEKERQRLQPDNFVGMTMQEAWDSINLTWEPNGAVPLMLVPGTNGRWAYCVYKGVYLEYPVSYYAQVSEHDADWILFMPVTRKGEQWNPWEIQVHIFNVPAARKDQNAYFLSPRENIVDESVIQTSEFEGMKFTVSDTEKQLTYLRAYQYNYENQLAVDILVVVNGNSQPLDGSDYSTMMDQKHEYFEHMVDHLHIQKR